MRYTTMASLCRILGGFTLATLLVGTVNADMNAYIPRTTELGQLDCTVLPETRKNHLLRSTAQVHCLFTHLDGTTEKYHGETGVSLGLDLRVKEDDTLHFLIVSTNGDLKEPSAFDLEGKYFGASMAASLGHGVHPTALMLNARSDIALQPTGTETAHALGVSLGLGFIRLEPDNKS